MKDDDDHCEDGDRLVLIPLVEIIKFQSFLPIIRLDYQSFTKKMNVLMMSASSREKLKGAYPEELEEGFHLNRETTGTVIKFNHLGNIFAVGCFDGTLSIYDSDTLSQISQFRVATSVSKFRANLMISNIEWFRDYKYIMCSTIDTISIWNIIEKRQIKEFKFTEQLITRAYICPSNQYV